MAPSSQGLEPPGKTGRFTLLLGLFLLALLAGELGPPVQRVFDLSFDAAQQLTR